MGKHILQIPGSDGCVYAYDADSKTLKRICEVGIAETPEDVLETIKAAGLEIAPAKRDPQDV
jgi:hypothetical protein